MKSNENADVVIKSQKERKSNVLTKIVIRRLPPTWTKEDFIEQFSPLPEHDYFSFVNADYSLGRDAFSRGYINFVNVDDIYDFRDKFDDYIFVDSKGGEYPALVEFAPYQKVPKKKSKKVDSKKGTIEEDADYLKFLDLLENPVVEDMPTMEATIEELEARERTHKGRSKVKTPLIEYIKRKREERRISVQKLREERRRRDAERLKQKEERRRKENESRFQGSKSSEKEKTPEKDGEKPKSTDKERLRFSKENREKLSKDKMASHESSSKERGASLSESKRELDRHHRNDERDEARRNNADTARDSRTSTYKQRNDAGRPGRAESGSEGRGRAARYREDKYGDTRASGNRERMDRDQLSPVKSAKSDFDEKSRAKATDMTTTKVLKESTDLATTKLLTESTDITTTKVLTESTDLATTKVLTESTDLTTTKVLTESTDLAATKVLTESTDLATTKVLTESTDITTTKVLTESTDLATTKVLTESTDLAATKVLTESTDLATTKVLTESTDMTTTKVPREKTALVLRGSSQSKERSDKSPMDNLQLEDSSQESTECGKIEKDPPKDNSVSGDDVADGNDPILTSGKNEEDSGKGDMSENLDGGGTRRRKKERPERALYVPRRAREAVTGTQTVDK